MFRRRVQLEQGFHICQPFWGARHFHTRISRLFVSSKVKKYLSELVTILENAGKNDGHKPVVRIFWNWEIGMCRFRRRLRPTDEVYIHPSGGALT
jgi:hypothetical protein